MGKFKIPNNFLQKKIDNKRITVLLNFLRKNKDIPEEKNSRKIINFLLRHKNTCFKVLILFCVFFIGKYSSPVGSGVYQYFYKPIPGENKLKIVEYVTEYNDNISNISKKFRVTKYTVRSSNRIFGYKNIFRGRRLIIPNRNVTIHSVNVKRKETLITISKKYHVLISTLIVFNKDLVIEKNIKSKSILKRGYYVAVPQLNEANFIWPLDNNPYIVSGYGWRRSPFNWRHFEMHLGIDLAANYETVLSTKSGRVIYSGYKSGYGLVVIVEHINNLKTVYGHLSKTYVRIGRYVCQGQRIGRSGNTGMSTGPHLHFEILKNNRYENPFHYYFNDINNQTTKRI